MVDQNTKFAIWLPFITVCLGVFGAITYRSVKFIFRSQNVRKSPTLLLIYISIDLSLLFCPWEILGDVFPDSEIAAKFASVCAVIDAIAIFTTILIFHSRIVTWLSNISRKNCILTGIFWTCWVLLFLLAVASVATIYVENIYSQVYFILCATILLALDIVVFFIFIVEYSRTTGTSVFRTEKMLSAYFCLLIVACIFSMNQSWLFIFSINSYRDFYWIHVANMYVSTFLYDILPPVLIFVMISGHHSPMTPPHDSSLLNRSSLTSL